MSILRKKWNVINKNDHSALEKVLENRIDIKNSEIQELHDPFLFNDMKKAVERIAEAIENQEKIVIFGDYDVDGITASAILIGILRKLNANIIYRLPNRVNDGYGLSDKFINEFIEEGVNLIITVDCGIACVDQIAMADENGIDTIITDHHRIQARIPKAYAILHPKDNSSYPCDELTGAGVAFKLAQALIETNVDESERENFLNSLLEFACMGTISDMGPLYGENRLIVQRGLKGISKTQWPGLEELKKVAKISNDKAVTASAIGFQLGPRINAAGRIGDPYKALELLIRDDNGPETEQLAAELETLNLQRREMTEQAIESAISRIDSENPPCLIFEYSADWHVGVLGLIAGKLSEKYGRPSIILKDKGDTLVASARSLEYFNIIEAITACSEHLVSFGGHAQAAGLTIEKSKLPEFIEAIEKYAKEKLKNIELEPTLNIDCEIQGKEINMSFLDKITNLAPFGVGNASPKFLIRNVSVESPAQVGKDKNHLRFTINTATKNYRVIAFRMGGVLEQVKNNPSIDLVFTIEKNNWNGREYIGIQALDFQINGE